MKRAILGIVLTILGACAAAGAQTSNPPAQNPPAAQAAPATPAAKRPPQAKTQKEFDDYKVAAAATDAPGLEKAADDFATKYPDSEIRVLLYKSVMRLYQNANNGEKSEAAARKVIGLDGDDPEALITVAEAIAERTHDTDLDKDQRYAEGLAMAQKSLLTIDTDITVPPGTPQDKLDAYKAVLHSRAYSAMGTIEYNKANYPGAQTDFQKAVDAVASQPYPPDVLRLALAIDKQQKYEEALKIANRAVELTQEGTPLGISARRERDRLLQLTGQAAPAQPQAPKN